ncbi:MAG: hypothetical protein ACI965_000770 [Paraglaciecola sp.]|jgi:hypothetical protein
MLGESGRYVGTTLATDIVITPFKTKAEKTTAWNWVNTLLMMAVWILTPTICKPQ